MLKRKWMVWMLTIMIALGTITTDALWSVSAKTISKKTGITVKKKAKKKICLNKKTKKLVAGRKFKLKLKNAKAKKVKWKSSNKKVARVKKGLVIAKKKGKATITATYKGKKYKCKITVIKKKVTPAKTTIRIKDEPQLLDSMYDGKNIVVSPLSLNMVLGMAANGATTFTKQEIEKYLDMFTEQCNQVYVPTLLRLAKNDSMLKIANGVWYKDGFEINGKFKTAVERYYNATVQATPFDDSTKSEINQWVAKNTDNMIPEFIKEFSSKDITAMLVNTLLFKGKWTVPFEAWDTKKETFQGFDNSQNKVKMMNDEVSSYYENKYATGFEKTYGNDERYSFIAILPKKSGEFKLSELRLEEFINSNRTDVKVDIKLPKFSYEWSDEGKLKTTLKSLGAGSIFNEDLNPLGNMMNISNQKIFASDVSQSCKIIVDEEGTKAAAVTSMEIVCGSAIDTREHKYVYLNRPFAYVIMDNKYHNILFMGKVVNPNEP